MLQKSRAEALNYSGRGSGESRAEALNYEVLF